MAEPREYQVEQIEALIRGLSQDALRSALDKTLQALAGVPREALASMLRGAEHAITKGPDLDATKLKTLPPETLEALTEVLEDVATEFSTLDEPNAALAPVDGDATAPFKGDVWMPDAREGSFRTFYEQNGVLERQEFLDAHPAPLLLTSISFDRATWSNAIVLPIVKKDPGDPDKAISVGRDPSCDLVIPHASLSKRHIAFTQQESRWFVTDLESSNGTKVDDVTIAPGKPVRLRDVTKLDLAGARLSFNSPAGLFHFVEQIRKLEGRKTGTLSRDKVKKALALPAAKPAEVVAPVVEPKKPALKKSSDKVPAQVKKSSAKVPVASPHEESRVKEAFLSTAALVGTPPRMAATAAMAAVLIFSIVRIGPPVAFMLFGESHPGWFEKDLPDNLKNR